MRVESDCLEQFKKAGKLESCRQKISAKQSQRRICRTTKSTSNDATSWTTMNFSHQLICVPREQQSPTEDIIMRLEVRHRVDEIRWTGACLEAQHQQPRRCSPPLQMSARSVPDRTATVVSAAHAWKPDSGPYKWMTSITAVVAREAGTPVTSMHACLDSAQIHASLPVALPCSRRGLQLAVVAPMLRAAAL